MDSDLEELWNKLSLSADEKSEVVIDKFWVEETANARRNCLLNKLFTKKVINMEAMKSVLHKIWRYVIQFGNQRSGRQSVCFPI